MHINRLLTSFENVLHLRLGYNATIDERRKVIEDFISILGLKEYENIMNHPMMISHGNEEFPLQTINHTQDLLELDTNSDEFDEEQFKVQLVNHDNDCDCDGMCCDDCTATDCPLYHLKDCPIIVKQV